MIEEELFRFTRQLIDVDSTTEREGEVGQFVAGYLRRLGGLEVEVWEVESGRYNVFARHGRPRVVLSTHIDTVPPFFPSREDDAAIHGRGACDAKGILAAQVFAARRLIEEGVDDFGLLFVVGEERNSAGALAANQMPQGSRFLVNGEPTESRMIRAGKGAMRLNLHAHGRAAHSAYPALGESAIDKLLEAITRLRQLALPQDPVLGETTINVGVIGGGRAPNVIPDEANAEILIRLVEDAAPLRERIAAALGDLVTAEFPLEIPPIALRTIPGFAASMVAFGTDIPKLSAWGEPLLFGPGSIEVAHTPHEFIAKAELWAAVDAYAGIVKYLMMER